MKIASLVVRAKPEDFPELRETLCAIPGVELHGESPQTGRMVVTVEDGEGYAVTDSILAVNLTKHVLGVTLAYEYTDEGLELQEA
ncbi:MAG TPA: chaperone NapD [Rhodocyclaceae bacterium]|jgi:periplasmic nitrate reductase NapD|nr:chaperone NapD [Rhodocyclaceae bacterium]HRQ47687.1 chaperone NapD [Rhodocyclaceae bacterium]